MMGLPAVMDDQEMFDVGSGGNMDNPEQAVFLDSSEYGGAETNPNEQALLETVPSSEAATAVTTAAAGNLDEEADLALFRQDSFKSATSSNMEDISLKKIEDMDREYGKVKMALLGDIDKSPNEAALVSPTPIVEPPFLRNSPLTNPKKPLERTRSKDKLESIFGAGSGGSFESHESPLVEDEDIDAIFAKNKMDTKINEAVTTIAPTSTRMPRDLSPPPPLERRNSGGNSTSLRSLKNERQRQHQEQQQLKQMQRSAAAAATTAQSATSGGGAQQPQQRGVTQQPPSKFANEQYPASPPYEDDLQSPLSIPRPSNPTPASVTSSGGGASGSGTNRNRPKNVYTIPEVSEEEEESPPGGAGAGRGGGGKAKQHPPGRWS